MAKHDRYCLCTKCIDRSIRQQARGQNNRGGGHRQRNWSPAYGGSDADGNPITVSFGQNRRSGETLIADGDQSESNFFDSANHDHYGSGNGPNNNGTRRGKYSGRGN